MKQTGSHGNEFTLNNRGTAENSVFYSQCRDVITAAKREPMPGDITGPPSTSGI
jgi:hypothetical protein